jgi:CTP synthase
VEAVELPPDAHPFYVASQYHPEFKSRPERPAPLFREFVGAALAYAESDAAEESAPVERARDVSVARSSAP